MVVNYADVRGWMDKWIDELMHKRMVDWRNSGLMEWWKGEAPRSTMEIPPSFLRFTFYVLRLQRVPI